MVVMNLTSGVERHLAAEKHIHCVQLSYVLRHMCHMNVVCQKGITRVMMDRDNKYI